MIPLFGDPESGDRRSVLEGRFIATALHALAVDHNVILDFGLWGRDERSALRWLASEEGATVELVYLPIDLPTQRARTTARVNDAPHTTCEYTDADLERQQAVYEVPTADEFEDVYGAPHGEESLDWRSWIEGCW